MQASVCQSPTSVPSTAVSKRIVVLCDGTWQDGVSKTHNWQYSNILKLSRAVQHQDDRSRPTPQVVFYQAGIGSENNIYSQLVQGTTGAGLAEKIQEGYAFITNNFQRGDEIFLFGFSRGAYTARMIATLIGEIGILDRPDMDHFADLFVAYQKRSKTKDPAEIEKYDRILRPFTKPHSKGRTRADADGDSFSVKCVGVFDTVGSVGLPEELTLSHKIVNLFGFPDRLLGNHIQYAFHAMALNETRADFTVAKFEQTQSGREKGQVLRQVWFTGSHSDIGGGWQFHDLSDLTLMWMTSCVGPLLALDLKYLRGLLKPCAPWGEQLPHDPETGVFKLSKTVNRPVASETDDVTHEYIHPSVLRQKVLLPDVQTIVQQNPAIICQLNALEVEIQEIWSTVPGQQPTSQESVDEAKQENESMASEAKYIANLAKSAVKGSVKAITGHSSSHNQDSSYQDNWTGAVARELQNTR